MRSFSLHSTARASVATRCSCSRVSVSGFLVPASIPVWVSHCGRSFFIRNSIPFSAIPTPLSFSLRSATRGCFFFVVHAIASPDLSSAPLLPFGPPTVALRLRWSRHIQFSTAPWVFASPPPRSRHVCKSAVRSATLDRPHSTVHPLLCSRPWLSTVNLTCACRSASLPFHDYSFAAFPFLFAIPVASRRPACSVLSVLRYLQFTALYLFSAFAFKLTLC